MTKTKRSLAVLIGLAWFTLWCASKGSGAQASAPAGGAAGSSAGGSSHAGGGSGGSSLSSGDSEAGDEKCSTILQTANLASSPARKLVYSGSWAHELVWVGATNERARCPRWSTLGNRVSRAPSLRPRLPVGAYEFGMAGSGSAPGDPRIGMGARKKSLGSPATPPGMRVRTGRLDELR